VALLLSLLLFVVLILFLLLLWCWLQQQVGVWLAIAKDSVCCCDEACTCSTHQTQGCVMLCVPMCLFSCRVPAD
jgi:hypothetical protein